MPAITQIFDPPLPSDSRTAFDTKAFATLGALNAWSEQANAVAEQVNEEATAVSETLAAVQAAQIGEVVTEVEALRDTTAGHATTATASATSATSSAAAATAAAAAAVPAAAVAEAARDAATVNANVYVDVATGLAAVANGVQFQVVAADGLSIQRYRRDAGPVAVQLTELATKPGIDALGIEAVTDDQETAFAVVDDAGRRTWLETTKSGAPTDHAAGKIGGVLTPQNSPALLGWEEIDPDLNAIGMAFTDADGRRTWLEFDHAGKPTTRSAALMVAAMQAAGYSLVPDTYKASHQAATPKIVSGPDIVCWGDSMTAGAGGGGTTYPNVLQGLLTAAGYTGTVVNRGVGGETSVTIAARANAHPFLLLPAAGVIPASGPVEVAMLPINGQTPRPLLQGSSTLTGVLSDIPGVLNLVEPNGNSSSWDAANYYTFQRTEAGGEITLNRPTPFYCDIGESHRDDVVLIWIGQNGPSNTRAIEDARAIVQHMTTLEKRYLVIGKPTTTDVDDAAWFSEFGRRYIAVRRYMVDYGLSDAGIEPTEGDITDIAAGVIPRSLRIDAVHWTAAGYTILGNLAFNRLNELGWI